MTTFGIAMVRDEADIIAATVSHMLAQVDEVIVADNGSVDGTREILAELGVTVIDDPEVGYYQARKMTALAALAADLGADWVVPFDADEWWYSPFGRIAEVLDGLEDRWFIAGADLYDHVATGADPGEVNPVTRMAWRRRSPVPLPKVACRVRPSLQIEQGNHGATYRGSVETIAGQMVVRHFPYRSAEQMARKARNGAQAYAATDLPAATGQHWRDYGALLEANGPESIGEVFRTWFWVADPTTDPTLIFDPVP